MDEFDVIWNDAADYGAEGRVPDGTAAGIEQLAWLLRVYNSAMGGGVSFALEVNEPFRIRRAIDAMRYFGLTAPADVLEDVLGRSLRGQSADSWPSDDDLYDLLDDETVKTAFREKAAHVPIDFGRQ